MPTDGNRLSLSLADEAEGLLDGSQQHRHGDSKYPAWIHGVSSALLTLKEALYSNKVYALLVFVPLGIVASLFSWHPVTVSLFNLLAIIPLSALVSYAADELSNVVGELVGGLINASFGNAVELVVGILALVHGEVSFVQSVMLGSILSDILLVLGCCLFSAAFGKQIPEFNPGMADALSSLMIVTATALILPTALYSTFTSSQEFEFAAKILAFSRASALVLLALYTIYLYFELTHPNFFLSAPEPLTPGPDDLSHDLAQEEFPLSSPAAIVVLLSAALGIVICAHLLLDSVDATAKATHITKTFIPAILIPIASNAPEAATIMAVSRGSKVNYGIGVIVGSILQIALFVIPFLVILGWMIQEPLTLYFETFQTTMLFLSVLVVNRLLQDRIYTYVQGAMLVALYAIIATVFFLRPEVTADALYKRWLEREFATYTAAF